MIVLYARVVRSIRATMLNIGGIYHFMLLVFVDLVIVTVIVGIVVMFCHVCDCWHLCYC